MSRILISQATFIKVIIESCNLLINIFDIKHTHTHTHTHTYIYIYIYNTYHFII